MEIRSSNYAQWPSTLQPQAKSWINGGQHGYDAMGEAWADWSIFGDLNGRLAQPVVGKAEERLVVQAAMPTSHLMVEDNILTIKGETKSDTTGEEVQLLHRERVHGAFRRSFRLPEKRRRHPRCKLLRGRRADRHLPPQGGDAPQATEDRGGQGRQRRRCQLVAAPSTEVNERGLWHAGGLFFVGETASIKALLTPLWANHRLPATSRRPALALSG